MNRNDFFEILGKIPQRVNLDTKIISEKDYGKYIQQKIEFYGEKNDIISAYVLIPKNISGKVSAIYCHHQHGGDWSIGKKEVVGLAGDPDLAYGKELAEKGFIVLAPDAIAFEDRQNNIGGGNGNYFELAQRIVNGEHLLTKTLFDISVGIDYLCNRGDVDTENIGFIGHSYGGRMAIVAPIFDERIKASVSHCGCVNYKDSIERDIGIQLEFCIPDILKYGDVEDLIKLANTLNLLISGTKDDKYSYGIEDIFKYAGESFDKKTLQVNIYEGGHIFTQEMREDAYHFLDKFLK